MTRSSAYRSGSTRPVALLLGSVATGLVACAEGPYAPDPLPVSDAPPGLVLSEPAGGDVSSAGGAAASEGSPVAYVSASPGTFPDATSIEIRNSSTGYSGTPPVLVIDGGFDPVEVRASAGDELELEIHKAGGERSLVILTVPEDRPPLVVRTDPPKGRTDVAFATRPIVIFTEPMDAGSLDETSVRLLRDGTPVTASVGMVPESPFTAQLLPASPLAPLTTYELVVTTAVRDLDGDALEAEVRIAFATRAAGPAAIQVRTTTSGPFHGDDYALFVDGYPGPSIGPDDSVTVAGLELGEHEVGLMNLAPDCVVEGSNPRIVTVGEETALTFFQVACTGAAAALTLVSGDDQVGRPGEPLAEPLVVQVADTSGVGVADVAVRWRIMQGDATLQSSFEPERDDPVWVTSTRTDADGLARVHLMPLGFESIGVDASLWYLPAEVSFRADATDPGASLVMVSGNGLAATAGQPLDQPFVLRLTDGRGEPATHVRVVWSVESGDGDLGRDDLGTRMRRDTVRTDADGLAQVSLTPSWFGPVDVHASAVGTGGSPLVFTADATDLGASVSIVSGNEQTGKANDILGEPLWVQATNGRGEPAANVRVDWSVQEGDGGLGDWSGYWDSWWGGNPSWSGYTDDQGLARVGFVPDALGTVLVDAQLGGIGATATFTTDVEVWVIHYIPGWAGPHSFTWANVPLGTPLEWLNHLGRAKIVSTSRPPDGSSFASDLLGSEQRFRFVPDAVGSWEYVDEIWGTIGSFRVYR